MALAMTLDVRQQAIIPIAAFTASGDLDKLKPVLAEGLEAGLSINETKEILVQMYAYAGFPRSLNGLSALTAILEERLAKGIVDPLGKEASPVPADLNRDEYGAKIRAKLSGLDEIPPPAAWQKFSPIADTFLKEHLHDRHGGPASLSPGGGHECRSDRAADAVLYRRAENQGRRVPSRSCIQAAG